MRRRGTLLDLPRLSAGLSGGAFATCVFPSSKPREPQSFFHVQRTRDTMNRMSIMAILIALLCLPFLSFQADTYPSRHHRSHAGHHYKHFHRNLAYQRSGDCTFTNDGRSICNGSYQAGASVLDPGGNRTFAMAADADPSSVRVLPAAPIDIVAVACANISASLMCA